MKLGPGTTLDKRNKYEKKLTMMSCLQIMTSLSFLEQFGQFGAIQKPDSRHIVWKTYIFINSNLKNITKTENRTKKISITALTLLL